jgi:Tfp pilus assembly protein PilF
VERINKLKEFLITNPDDCFVQHALALEYIKIGDDETGKELFEKILSKNPEYVGSYYHLAKLLDRIGETQKAIDIYEKGMEEAKKVNDMHAFGELRSAYEELTF